MHSVESRFVTKPENPLFAGMCVCVYTFQPRKFVEYQEAYIRILCKSYCQYKYSSGQEHSWKPYCQWNQETFKKSIWCKSFCQHPEVAKHM